MYFLCVLLLQETIRLWAREFYRVIGPIINRQVLQSCVYRVLWFCYQSAVCSFAVSLSTSVSVFVITSSALLFLNSTLNPVIYCWKMRHIRRAFLEILRNIEKLQLGDYYRQFWWKERNEQTYQRFPAS